MRHALANVFLASTLGGCSLVYNPSNIPAGEPDAKVDAMADAEIIVDADPTMLALDSVFPSTLVEGQGVGGSRPAVIVIHGHHLVQDNTTVTITASPDEKRSPMVMVDDAGLQTDSNGHRLAIPVTLPVDETLGAGEEISLDITVTHEGPLGPVSQTLSGALTLRGLGELDGDAPAAGLPAGVSEFSRVHITGGTLKAASGATGPVRIRSTSSLTIETPTSVNVAAAGQAAGPGGGRGGDGGAGGLLDGDPGKAGEGPAPGQTSGANASYIGNSQLTTLDRPNRSSGGAGGNGASLGARGGNGGGGGGSVELTAAGDLSISDIAARGAPGESAGGGVASPGGGGSGGIVLLRAGGTLSAGTVDVGGHPTAGRVRFDAGGMATLQNQDAHYRGPMFASIPLITTQERPEVTVSGGPLTGFRYYIVSEDGADVRGPFDDTIANNGMKTLTLAGPLFPGSNEVCLLVEGATATSDTRTCIRVVHLYRP